MMLTISLWFFFVSANAGKNLKYPIFYVQVAYQFLFPIYLKLNKIFLITLGVGELFSQSIGSSGMNYYFTASGCMSERIKDRYEKTSPSS
jgi:hypothetical protein